ncbi:MAG: GMC family oxidoreductase, partial [Alphaproteobacteria bacterium]|nr:GMC family oxidoreductase [Alphaproteobacteria bacterium]
ARALRDSELDIVVLEAGGLEIDADSQEIYEGEIVGLDYYPIDTTRLRYFGGSTNHWSGRCMKLDPIDFKKRSWIPNSGWPIERDELLPYYQPAQEIVELSHRLEHDQFWEEFDIEPPGFDSSKLVKNIDQRSPPTRFGEVYGEDLEAAERVTVWLHANVLEIGANQDADHVESVTVKSFKGKEAVVKAKAFVLACGAMENARLLLANRGAEPHGFGNRHDLVGRYFSDHAHVLIGDIITPDPVTLLDAARRQFQGGAEFQPRFALPDALQEEFGVTNSACWLVSELEASDGMAAAADLIERMRGMDGRPPLTSSAWRVMVNLDDVAVAAWQRFIQGKKTVQKVSYVGLFGCTDPVPNPDSRVLLDEDDVDAFGMPRAVLDWRLTEQDHISMRKLAEVMGAELARTGLGRLKLHDWFMEEPADDWMMRFHGSPEAERFAYLDWISNHNIGTTRMADDPKQGVVDGDCKMHHVDNFYIAGSSVFPTSGSAQPTLTIVALALRLADHLKEKVG